MPIISSACRNKKGANRRVIRRLASSAYAVDVHAMTEEEAARLLDGLVGLFEREVSALPPPPGVSFGAHLAAIQRVVRAGYGGVVNAPVDPQRPPEQLQQPRVPAS